MSSLILDHSFFAIFNVRPSDGGSLSKLSKGHEPFAQKMVRRSESNGLQKPGVPSTSCSHLFAISTCNATQSDLYQARLSRTEQICTHLRKSHHTTSRGGCCALFAHRACSEAAPLAFALLRPGLQELTRRSCVPGWHPWLSSIHDEDLE